MVAMGRVGADLRPADAVGRGDYGGQCPFTLGASAIAGIVDHEILALGVALVAVDDEADVMA